VNVPGLSVRKAHHSHADCLSRLEAAFSSRGIVPVARINHQVAAANFGLPLAPIALFLFGNPRAGTPLMEISPTLGIDLPLKILVWESDGVVSIGYNDPVWLVQRHGGNTASPILQAMRDLLEALSTEAAG